jgi:hypothetical protein
MLDLIVKYQTDKIYLKKTNSHLHLTHKVFSLAKLKNIKMMTE